MNLLLSGSIMSIATLLSLAAWVAPAHATRIPLVEDSCTLAGINSPVSMAHTPDGFAILDTADDQIEFFDAQCQSTRAPLSTAAYAAGPQGLTWASDLGEYAVVDDLDDQVYFVDPSGTSTGSCDLATIGSNDPSGITRDVANGYYLVTDGQQIYVLTDANRLGGSCDLVTTLNLNYGADDITMDPLGRPAPMNQGTVWWVDNTGNIIDKFDLDRTLGDDDGAVWDPAANDRVLVVNGSTLYRIDARATLTTVCNTGLATEQGMSVGPAPGEVLIADAASDQVLVYDTVGCSLVRAVDASAVPDFAGAAWDPTTGEIVAAGGGQNQGGLWFLDGVTGAVLSTCSTLGTSADWPSGIEMLPELDLIAVSSRTRESWTLLDRACNPVHVRSTTVLADQLGNLADPFDIGWMPVSGRFVVVNSSYFGVAAFEGTAQAFFNLRNDGNGSDGVAAVPGVADAFFSIKYGVISRVDMPALAENLTLSGHFVSPSADVFLWDRGDGRVSGTAEVNGDTLPLTGLLTDGGSRLVITTITAAGAALTAELTVSGDLMTLTGAGPIGVLTRQ